MKPGLKRAAYVGTALMLLGWVVAVMGFATTDSTSAIPDMARVGVRVFGFIILMTGATITVFASIGAPTLAIVVGVALNLAHQAGIVPQAATGIFGAGLILLGTLWASKRIRVLPT